MVKLFSTTKSAAIGPEPKRIGTLSLGILTRKKIRDRKNRVRRRRVEVSVPLVSGVKGAMNTAAAIANVNKELAPLSGNQLPLTPKKFRKIVEVLTPEK